MLAGGTWLGLSRSGKLAVITNSPSEWDNYLTSISGRVKSIVLRSAAVVAAASAAAVASRRQEDGRVTPLGLLCAAGAVAAGSVGLAVAVTMATRRSRGALVTDFLEGKEDARTYSTRLSQASFFFFLHVFCTHSRVFSCLFFIVGSCREFFFFMSLKGQKNACCVDRDEDTQHGACWVLSPVREKPVHSLLTRLARSIDT